MTYDETELTSKEIQKLRMKNAELKTQKEQIEAQLDRITITKTKTAPWVQGVTDQFKDTTTSYKEFTDPVKGKELTTQLNNINHKIEMNESTINNILLDQIRKRSQGTPTTTVSNTVSQGVSQTSIAKSNESEVDKSKEFAFNHLKHLYKSKSIVERLKVHLSGKKIDWNVIQNLSADEISKLSDTFAGKTDIQMTRDEQRKEKYQAEGKRLSEIKDLQTQRHWNEFVAELQKKSIKQTNTNGRLI